jgi:hypothetical protein
MSDSSMRFIEPPQPNDRWIKIVDPLTQQEIRHFYPDKADKAWAWLLG